MSKATLRHLPEKEIRIEGWNVLVKKLGLAGATRFLLEYQTGEGDYVKERKNLFINKNVKQISNEIK